MTLRGSYEPTTNMEPCPYCHEPIGAFNGNFNGFRSHTKICKNATPEQREYWKRKRYWKPRN